MSSTNKTTHYDLSQYTANDKPTYLVDYNSDMSNIDTGIYNAQTTANESEAAIGTLSTLNTTDKSSLVNAINEVDGNVDTLSGTVGQHTTDIASNTSAIGNLANLNTTDKTNLVNAVNEVDGDITKLNNSFNIIPTSSLININDVTGTNATITGVNIRICESTNGDLGKIYGNITFTATYTISQLDFACDVSQTDTYSISNLVLIIDSTDNKICDTASLTLRANKTASILCNNLTSGHSYKISIIPCILYYKDFGDVTPE